MVLSSTLKRYLKYGLCATCFFSMIQCKKAIVDAAVRGTFIYVNKTNAVIEVKGTESFVIHPEEDYVLKTDNDGPEKVTADSYVPPLHDAIIVYDNNMCDTLQRGSALGKGESILGIGNYTNERLGDRNYKFTYTFTDVDLQKAKGCP